MLFFTVHEPPDGPSDPIERAERLIFIPDGMTKAAVPFGPLWLVANGLWLAALAYVALLVAIALVAFAFGLSPNWLSLSIAAMNLWLAFEASSLRRWNLERQGWITLGTVSGRTLDEAERRFLESYLDGLRAFPRQTREQEFIDTVNVLRNGGASAPLAAVPGGGLTALAGELPDSGRLSGATRRSWLPGWFSGRADRS